MPEEETIRVNISVNKADWDAAKAMESEYVPKVTRQGIATVAFNRGLKLMKKEIRVDK